MRISIALAMLFVAATAACGSSSTPRPSSSPTLKSSATSATPAPAAPAWPTYHRDAARSGDDSTEPSFASMSQSWNTPKLDGDIWAEPLIDGTHVLVVTENDSVYSFDATSGTQQWHTNLGTPRTSNFPCGDIMPLGITSTPVIDGGYLYVVAETEQSHGAYRFQLAKINPESGAVAFNDDITPNGMNTNAEQQRSALAVSQGNVVVTWGGLDGDCGNYHGYVETVTEATGKVAAVWQNTPNDNEGGIWTPAGPAVDAAGDIFVASGNGSTTNIGAYDDANSVTKLSPGLMRLSFFAPGPPQQWTALNASDNDLGSTSPALLSNGLLFQIGKGGRGYLLSQSQLPNNSNPGGGEAASLQVCDKNSFAALSGVAVAGSMVFVPCVDGIAAVSVESPTAMHRVWYSAAGSSAPIVAGGVVWSAILYGGTTLYGLDPANGNVVAQLNLGNTTMHFATPAAANGRLYMAAGSTLLAFAPH